MPVAFSKPDKVSGAVYSAQLYTLTCWARAAAGTIAVPVQKRAARTRPWVAVDFTVDGSLTLGCARHAGTCARDTKFIFTCKARIIRSFQASTQKSGIRTTVCRYIFPRTPCPALASHAAWYKSEAYPAGT